MAKVEVGSPAGACCYCPFTQVARRIMAIPPYLTSGASSRAHHALIVALNEAKSVQEEDAIVEREIRRAREVLSSRGAMVRSPDFTLPAGLARAQLATREKFTAKEKSKISETLVVLLHCSMMGGTAHKLDWALMPALQLAEGGKTVDERRIGASKLLRWPHKRDFPGAT